MIISKVEFQMLILKYKSGVRVTLEFQIQIHCLANHGISILGFQIQIGYLAKHKI